MNWRIQIPTPNWAEHSQTQNYHFDPKRILVLSCWNRSRSRFEYVSRVH